MLLLEVASSLFSLFIVCTDLFHTSVFADQSSEQFPFSFDAVEKNRKAHINFQTPALKF
jgi:hypothetical protein